MPLSPNEIKERAAAFAHKLAGEDSERAEAQSFWNDFSNVFGVERKRVAVFEKQVQLARAVDAAYGKNGFAAEAERVASLFDLYRQTTSLLPAVPVKRRGKRDS